MYVPFGYFNTVDSKSDISINDMGIGNLLKSTNTNSGRHIFKLEAPRRPTIKQRYRRRNPRLKNKTG